MLLLSLSLPARADGPLADVGALRAHGTAALPEVLRHVNATDPDLRLRARRLARWIALDYYRKKTPAGMRLVPGRVLVSPKGIQMTGGFYLAIREVTAREFLEHAGQRGLNTKRWAGKNPADPVSLVTLAEARGFAAARGARLPTLAELRQATTDGGRARYPWGDRFESRRVNSVEAGLGKALPSGSRPMGRSAAGIDDLLGNVAEWTSSPVNGAKQPRYCVVGGSYLSHARGLISQDRFVTYRLRAVARRRDVGFRLARSLPEIPLEGS